MDPIVSAFRQLSQTLKRFIDEYELAKVSPGMAGQWNAQDILRHVTYWHRYYANNLAAEARGTTFIFPKTKYSDLNQEGVYSLQHYTDDKLLAMLRRAHKQLGLSIESGKVTQMTYREGSRPYSLLEFIQVVDRHIQGHTTTLKKCMRN